MRRRSILHTVALVGAVVAVAVGGLWISLPGAEQPEEGAADPVLWLRRPILRALRAGGVVPSAGDGFLSWDLWLPGRTSSDSWSGTLPEERMHEAESWTADEVTVEPVYRGLLWRTGFRITVTSETKPADAFADARVLLYAVVDGERLPLGEGRAESGIYPGSVRFRAHGFAPSTMRGFGYRFVSADGHEMDSGGSSWDW